jgi:hypothetical protein
LEDNVFGHKPFLWALRAAKREENQEGGEQIVQPLMYAKARNSGSYSGNDTFTTEQNEGISAALFPWRQHYGLVSFEGIELAKNKGKSALLSLMQARLTQLELTIADEIETMLFGDGSGNSGKDFMGLQGIVSTTDPAGGALGGIARATNEYWRAVSVAQGGGLSLAKMANTYNTASEGNDHPSIVFATQAGFEVYEGLVQTNLRHESTKMGDAGFQNLMYKGAPMTFSENVPAQTMYFLNLKYISLMHLSGVWFKPTEPRVPINQDALYKAILSYGNLTVSNCQRQGKLTGITNG